jgi:hypothetical protein
MLRPSRIHIGSIEIRMAGFQLHEKSADAFLEDAFVRGSQGGGLLIDFSTPFPVIDLSCIEMVLENEGLHP